MFGKYFTYNNHSSEDFDLMIGGFDYTENISFAMGRTVYKGGFTTVRKIPNFMGTEYNDVLTFEISCIKDVCKYPNQDEMVFTEDEVDEIVSWLTESNYPILFHMYDYEPEVYKKYDYFAVVSDVTPQTFAGDVVGFNISFTTNSPYAWSELKKLEYENTGENTYIVHVKNSERLGMIFPKITILPAITGEPGRVDVTIANERDGGQMDLSILKDETVIDCQRSLISNTTGLLHFDDLGISDVDQIYWFRLYNGENNVTLSGDATFTIEYREPRKVGAY